MCISCTSGTTGKLSNVFALLSQLLVVTVSIVQRGTMVFLRVGGDSEDTYLPPPVGLPAGASPGPAGLLCPGT